MKLTQHTYTHAVDKFNLKVEGAGKKLVTTRNVETDEQIKFNRAKFEWMIKKGIFVKNEKLSSI